ncbi:KH domain-containing, RNA-binding, signal transduction-associated protein 2-like [Rhodnius prolixus]
MEEDAKMKTETPDDVKPPTSGEEKPPSKKQTVLLKEYLDGLLMESDQLDKGKFPEIAKIIHEKIGTLKNRGHKMKAADLLSNSRKYRVIERVLIPSSRKYKNNAVISKLLGFKGRNLRQLERDTKTKLLIRGRGSMADRKKEEQLAAMMDPKFEHLAQDLHIEIHTEGKVEEAHIRVADAVECLRQNFLKIYDELEPNNFIDLRSKLLSKPQQFHPQAQNAQYQSQNSQYQAHQQQPPPIYLPNNRQVSAQEFEQFMGMSAQASFLSGGRGVPMDMLQSASHLGPIYNRNNLRPSPYDRQLSRREILLRN